MKKKNLTLFFDFFDHEHLGKDPFMVPYYLGKALNCSVNIIYPLRDSNKDLPSSYKGVNFCPYIAKDEKAIHRGMYHIIWDKAKDIDYMMRFFDTYASRKAAFIYKLRNPKGKVYIKMDVNPYNINHKMSYSPKSIIYGIINNFLKSKVDVISCETTLAFTNLKNSPNSYNRWGNKMVYLPNGFDESLLKSLNLKERHLAEKENIMITVGRLGSPPKNTPMLLQALAKTSLKNWRFYLVGPIDPSLQPHIDSFYQENPDKKDSVVFTGAIYDKKELWEYYNRSKVFVLTSRWEGFALVYTEAQRFRNYIISTEVGASRDVIENKKYGDYIEQEDFTGLAEKLQNIIDGVTDINVYQDFDVKALSWEKRLEVIADRLK